MIWGWIIGLRKSNSFLVRISDSISLIIWKEHGFFNFNWENAIDLLPYQQSNYKLVCLVPWQSAISVTSLRHQYDAKVVTITHVWRHWYRSMADSVGHVPPNFQWHNKLKFFKRNFWFSQPNSISQVILRYIFQPIWEGWPS